MQWNCNLATRKTCCQGIMILPVQVQISSHALLLYPTISEISILKEVNAEPINKIYTTIRATYTINEVLDTYPPVAVALAVFSGSMGSGGAGFLLVLTAQNQQPGVQVYPREACLLQLQYHHLPHSNTVTNIL